jgi:hypothetical protein
MLSLSSTSEAAAALHGAYAVSLVAYTLRRGWMFDALEAAARDGAHVSVRLEGAPYGDANGSFAKANRATAAALKSAGVDALLADPADGMIHAKVLDVDGSRYLDDRNWGADDLVLRDDDPADAVIATHKRQALTSEAGLLRAAQPGDDIAVESESFGCCNAVYSALDDAAKCGFQPRVLVCARELRGNTREAAMLQRLARDGAQVRVTSGTDKLALDATHAWLGSANATAAIATPDTIDWSARSDDPRIVAAVRGRFESNWSHAKRLDV